VTRKEFLKIAAGPTALAAIPAAVAITAAPARADIPDASAPTPNSKTFALSKGQFSLSLTTGNTLQCKLTHVPTNTVLADGPYSYSLGPMVFMDLKQDASSVTLVGATGTGITLEHRLSLNDQGLEEAIKLTNSSSHPLATSFRCGFVLPVGPDTLKGYTFTAVPYRREPSGDRNQYADYTLDQILYERRRSHLREKPEIRNEVSRYAQPRVFTEDFYSEGWALTDGKNGFLVTKYNQTAREFTILDRVPLPGDRIALRWGGAGKFDDAEGCYRLAPGKTHDFGVTRLTPFQGDFVQGYYAFRAEMEVRGHTIADSYDPPSHWNELYDNKLWWNGDHTDPNNRKKYYLLSDLKEAAAKARDMNCEALYLDPGWDTPQSAHIWGEERLGKLTDFIAMLKNDYGGLKLSVHAPLSSWTGGPNCDIIPGTALVKEKNGGPSDLECGACDHYIEETVKRLKVLADAGICFFMFDGTVWMGECWAKDHGHSYPSTAAEHVEGMNRIARMAHKNNSDVLIEMHDQLFGGIWLRYCPSYYGHGMDAAGEKGWDEIWAFELMWNPMSDLVGGHSIALYYFNLAYSLPAYIHIDLRSDNEHGLMLWWNISTCRHLGVGGSHADANVRATQKSIIGTYRRLKHFYTTGVFYGIDETIHVHVDRKKTGAVLNIFNLTDKPASPEIKFDPTLYGLDPAKTYKFNGTTFPKTGNVYAEVIPPIGPYAHQLIEVTLD
jgi:hypothetical protein